mmetsp:Transcript_36859/g.118944  ORF Transcript_36859/g.118944 Transcript_36859/m.118944 type:complete len:86 (+) Transcript_36859:287-544(+)
MTSSTTLLLEALARRPALVGALSLYACCYVAAGRAITRPAAFGPRCAARPRASSLHLPSLTRTSLPSTSHYQHRKGRRGTEGLER